MGPPPPAAAPVPPAPRGASLCWDGVYLCVAVLLLPFFAYRRWIKRKQSAPLREKLGHIPSRSANVPRVWIHAVSVGEAAAAEVLVKALRRRLPALDVAVSTTTVTGQDVARKRYGAENVFYYPLDFSRSVKRALDRVRPSVLVLMELEVWPNMTAEAAARGIPVIVVNGRITERSARRYGQFWRLAGNSFKRVQRWLVQSAEYAERLRALGVPAERIAAGGNLKYDAVDTLPVSAAERADVRQSLGLAADAPVLIGGSTHPSEEAALLDACARLKSGPLPALRLILVPRHPERAAAVASEIQAAGFGVVRRSEVKARGLEACVEALPAAQRENFVWLIDTVGELKNMYKAAGAAFVGGSLVPHGGQNVMEPCGLGVAVVHGPHMHNFNDAMELLRACNGSVEATRETLPAALETLFCSPQTAREMAARARQSFLSAQGAAEKAAEYIASQLPQGR